MLLKKPLLTLLFFLFCFGAAITSAKGQIARSETPDESFQKMTSKIQRTVDPDFVYDYKQSKFIPPEGQTLLIMGQTVERINEYMEYYADRPLPGGWSAYWGIPEFKGVTSAHRNETGASQHHQMLVDLFPNTVIQSAMWMVGKWDVARKAGKGDYNDVVKKYASWAKSIDRPIYLRIGHEFDGPHNELDPEEYIKAYRRIVNLLRKEGADNIAFVWHSYASKTYMGYPVSDWYPGNEYVDWVGISVFGHAYSDTGFGADCDAVLAFARQHQKPVMIAESNPIYGISKENTEVWDDWFINFFSFIYEKNIKAVSFINENWNRTYIEGIEDWEDARLSNNELVAEAWFHETNRERYLKQSEELFKRLGYIKEN
jgi:beta-mannanase